MRALAQFIMRGRVQASLVALAGNLVPLISPATVGLVTLRSGFQDGLLVLLWAALPLLVALYMTGGGDFVILSSVLGLLSLVISAQVLKATVSWQLALVTILAACSVFIILAGGIRQGEVSVVAQEVQAVVTRLESVSTDTAVSPFHALMAITAAGLGVEKVTVTFVLGFLSWLSGLNVIASLLLARWWQALLYNPGGFQQEFHGLRLGVWIASVLMAGVVACNVLTVDYMTWANLLGLPLLLSGLGLVHFSAKLYGMNVFWLVLMYAGLIFVSPLSMVLIVVGFLDSFMNFRGRLARDGK